jgi:peptidyl-prolyl cis-trans isomerase B (cyclophilin B)
MSIVRKPGKLRNPPRAKQYATTAVIVLIVIAAVGGGAYYYTTHGGKLSLGGTGTSSTSSSGTTNSTSSSAATGSPTSTTSTSSASTGSAAPIYAIINTTNGTIEAELYPSDAPKTVANFVSLANSGFYNGLVWHRIVKGFVIQTGDPTTKNGGGNRATWGQGTSGTNIPFENSPLQNVAGSLAMASTGAGVGGSSQFYINLVNNPSLDGSYTVFGMVISGMSVVQTIGNTAVNPSNDQPINAAAAEVTSITIQSSP